MQTVKSFKDSQGMWDGFAGCECWENGDEPVYCLIGQWLVIADAQGVCVYGDEAADEYGGLYIELVFPASALAISFLHGLPDTFNPVEFGAKSYA